MRHGTSNRRSRNRGNGGNRGNQNKTQVFDSNGPDVRIRGTAFQVHEKYSALAKDASSAGDLILAESYMQYAEHYQRVISGWEVALSNGGLYPDEMESASADDSNTRTEEDDLSLPASIIGKQAEVTSKKMNQKELTDA